MRGRTPLLPILCYAKSSRSIGAANAAPADLPSRSFSRPGRRCHEVSSAIWGRFISSSVDISVDYERDQPYDDVKEAEKGAALGLALSQLAPSFDKISNMWLHRFNYTRKIPTISTGSLNLDRALGIGGLPKGRMVEIYGKEASGKTTLALHIVKEAQKLGGNCVYLDVENAIDPSLVEAMGINTEDLLIAKPSSAENSLNIVHTLIQSESVDVIVVDSVAALVPQCEIDSEISMEAEQVQSRLMTQGLRKINYPLGRSQTLVILLNQVRMKLRPDISFRPSGENTCGGNALKFYSAVRLRLRRDCLLRREKDEVNGIRVQVEVTKNLLAPAMKTAALDIRFGHGIRREVEMLDLATEHGIASRAGDGYIIYDKFLGSREEAEMYISGNKGLQEDISSLIRAQLFNTEPLLEAHKDE